MSATVVVVDVAARPAVEWREVRCRDPACRRLLFRYRTGEHDPRAERYVHVEIVCPDRRCRRSQRIKLPAGAVVID